MFKLDDPKEKRKFVLKEVLALVVFMTLCLCIVFIRFCDFLYYAKVFNDKTLNQTSLDIIELGSMIIITIMFASLVCYLSRYFFKEFRMNIKNMLFFFVAEISLNIILFAGHYDKTFCYLIRVLVNLGIYPI
jgi:hypothetical protein